MVKTVAIVVVALLVVSLAGILLFAAFKPDTFRVQRAISVKASPDKIFPLIADFHRWGAWSPYEKLDPAMKREFSGAANGKGAVYEWDSDGKAGRGRMEITDGPHRPGGQSNSIFSNRSRPTTSRSSRWSPEVKRRTSPGPCTVPTSMSRKS